MNAKTLIDRNWNLLTSMTDAEGKATLLRLLGYIESARSYQMTKPKVISYIVETASKLEAQR